MVMYLLLRNAATGLPTIANIFSPFSKTLAWLPALFPGTDSALGGQAVLKVFNQLLASLDGAVGQRLGPLVQKHIFCS